MVASVAVPEETGTQPTPRSEGRFPGLDGLRGAWALIVMLCHTFLVVPVMAYAYFAPELIPEGTGAWWATFSPLHLAWAGTEGVYLFFVMSGFVLSLPFVRKPQRLAGYYPKRMIRLYVPTWGAFVLLVLWMTLFPRVFGPGDSPWLLAHPPELAAENIRSQLLLLPSAPMAGNTVLWTLRFEVIFSLILPPLFWLLAHFRKLNLLKALALFGVIYLSSPTPYTMPFFVSMFALGVVMAMERDRLAAIAERIRGLRQPRLVWWALSVIAGLLLINGWIFRGVSRDPTFAGMPRISAGLIVLGGCLSIFLASVGSWRDGLQKPVPRWLGTRSFSLYLVHEPIAVSVGVLLGGRPALLPVVAIAVPVSLVTAELFYRVVERPSLRLARNAGRKFGAYSFKRRPIALEGVPVPD